MQSQLFSGARGQITYTRTGTDGKKATATLAFVTDVSVNIQEGLQPIYVVGQIEPKSIEPLSYDVTVRVGRVIPITHGTGAAGTPATNLKAQDKYTSIDYGFEEIINQILVSDTVEIEVKDQVTGETISVIRNCRCTGRSTSVSSGDIARESYTFVGIYDGGYAGTDNASPDINYGLEAAPTSTTSTTT